MKKILYFLMPFLCAGLVGCSEDYVPAEGGIEKIESTDLNFTAAGGEGSITVDGFGWITAVSNRDWCEVRVEGTTVHVMVAESQEPTSRSAVVTLSADGKSVEVPVVQAGALATLGDYNAHQVFDYEGGTFELSFKSNVSYSVEIPAAAKSWISYVEDTDEETAAEGWTRLVFTAAPNEAEVLRGAEVSFSTGGRDIPLSIVEMEAADIIGTWDCSYTGVDGEMSGQIQIINYGQYGLMMEELSYGTLFPVAFSNGLFAVYGGRQVGTMSGYLVVTAVGGSFSGALTTAPYYDDGKLVIKVGDASTYLSLYLIHPSTGIPLTWLEEYNGLTITKQIQ